MNIKQTKRVEEKIAACFSMAIFNKNYLSNTIRVATTDTLTGVLNRVVYINDVKEFDENQPVNFACVYIDVNELHLCNNKFGHAAGDEMLLYIANTLKEAFYGQKIYRMGGDEFLIFCTGVEAQDVKRAVEIVQEQLKPRDYHVAVGISYRTMNTDTEEMVKEAEVRMYEAKAAYYQQKEKISEYRENDRAFLQAKTGIGEIDTLLSILQENYNGIYRVSLNTDKARRILMPAQLNYNEYEDNFSELFAKYVSDTVNADYHRSLMSFMNYDALRQQLVKGIVPTISFRKMNGDNVALSVYKLSDDTNSVDDTLWVFAKK
jgi:diguanylate cyclase (GGDEF)-like protein